MINLFFTLLLKQNQSSRCTSGTGQTGQQQTRFLSKVMRRGVAQRAKNVHSRPVIISEWYIYLIYHIVR